MSRHIVGFVSATALALLMATTSAMAEGVYIPPGQGGSDINIENSAAAAAAAQAQNTNKITTHGGNAYNHNSNYAAGGDGGHGTGISSAVGIGGGGGRGGEGGDSSSVATSNGGNPVANGGDSRSTATANPSQQQFAVGDVRVRTNNPRQAPSGPSISGDSIECDPSWGVTGSSLAGSLGIFGPWSDKDCKRQRATRAALEAAEAYERLTPTGRAFAAAMDPAVHNAAVQLGHVVPPSGATPSASNSTPAEVIGSVAVSARATPASAPVVSHGDIAIRSSSARFDRLPSPVQATLQRDGTANHQGKTYVLIR